MEMTLNVDPSNPADLRQAVSLLQQVLAQLPRLPAESVSDGAPVEVRMLNNLWPRIGRKTRALVLTVRDRVPEGTTVDIETLAGHLGRSFSSVKATLNASLRKAILSAQGAVPGAPELFVWQKNNEGRWEIGMTATMRAAMADRTEDGGFTMIPTAE